MKKILCFIVISFLVVNTFNFDLQAKENESVSWDVPGVYPINVYDETWGNMTFAEQLEAVALPNELVDSLSTEDLTDWVFTYPFLGDLCLFDSARASMDYFSRTSYLFRSFFAREDVIEVLLNKYDDLQVDYMMLAGENAHGSDLFTKSGYWQELFLQSYFATVVGDLSENEKVILKDILEEKYIEKVGICEDFSTVTLFFDNVLAECGEIPDELVFSTNIVPYEITEKVENSDSILSYSEGFTNSGQIATYNGGYYYVGVYGKYGVSANCYKFCYGELSSDEVTELANYIATYHRSWTKVSDATRKFNCHSYAWIQQSTSNDYWLPSPNTFASSSSFSYIGANGGANNGDHIIITDSYGVSQHSLIATSTGTNANSIYTISKCGKAGVYSALLGDIVLAYGNEYEVYR